MKKFYIFICLLFGFSQYADAQVSMNMTLLDNWDPSGQNYNDVWGYVDGTGKEYAIVGSYDKIHFLEITASNTLSLVDQFDPNGTSTWRDFKTYGNYAYAVSEGGNTGLLVYDLSDLPNSVSLSNQTTSHFTRAHNIYIDEPDGKLYVCGTNTQSNGLIVYDVTTNPPTHLASVPLPGGGYVHDLYVRGDTAYCSHGNDGFYIWDMDNPSSPNFLASYTGEPGYNHSSWVTPDGNTAFYAREVGVGLPMTALDISNYNNISVTSNWKFPLLAPSSTNNVPHNPYLLGDYLFTSYYEDGIQVFDVSDPSNVTVAGYYDTYPSNTQYNGYEGCWGAYPYLPSGKILASDGDNGLFLLEFDTNPLVMQITTQVNVSCNGENDGSLNVIGAGGTPPYSFNINNGTPQSTGFFGNLSAGIYDVEVTDNGGNSITTPVTITEPDPLIPFITSQINNLCAGDNNGTVVVAATGGTAVTNYLFSLNSIDYSSNNVFTSLTAGVYGLWVKDDNDCVSNTTFQITEPLPLQSNVNTLTHVDCFGNNTGSVTFNTLGGTPNFFYSIDQTNYQPSNSFSNLIAGNYTLTTIDANNCQNQIPFTITEPSALGFSISQQTNLDCFGENDGEIILSGSGGNGSYQYNIDGGNYQSSATFGNLEAGSYDFNIKDQNDCIATLSATITSPSEIVAQLSSIANVDCFGNNTGSVTVDLSGGSGDFSTNLNGVVQTGSPVTFNNLAAGAYQLFIEDGNNCSTFSNFDISENSEIQLVTSNVQNVSCFQGQDGSIELFAVGGTGSYTYFINGTSNGNNNTFTSLSAGQYSMMVMDDLNCQKIIPVTIGAPTQVIGSVVSLNNVSCAGQNDGSVTLNATGGAGNYQFFVNGTSNTTGIFNSLPAGNYLANILDQNTCLATVSFDIGESSSISAQIANQTNALCFGENSGSVEVQASGGSGNLNFTLGNQTNSTGIFQNLTAGNYNVQITDANNCQASVSVDISQPAQINSSINNQQNVICFGENSGSIEVQASGGNGNFNFTLGNQTNSTGIFQNLSAGNYNVQITDANNCQSSIAFDISQPAQINSSILNQQNVICFGENSGSIEVQASGGNGNLNFTLGNQTNSTGIFQNLIAGNYNIQITDANNCQSAIAFDISQPAQINSSILNQQNVFCFGENSGSIEVQATGGNGNLNFTLGNETNSTGIFQNLTAGNYNIQITDANNCQSSIAFDISQPSQINSSILNQQNVLCFGENSGSIEVQASGGNGNLNFSLGNETNSTGIFQNLIAGNYNIQITDANNCQSSIAFDISQPAQINSSILNQQNVFCFGENSGSIEVQASGGNGNLNFSLGNEINSTGIFQNLTAGNYNIQVTDANNCQIAIPFDISQPAAELTIQTDNVQLASCNGQQGSIQVSASGGASSYTFSNGTETNSTGFFGNLSAGIYMISVTDANNCSASTDVNIIEPNSLNVQIVNTQNPNCNGENSGTVQLNAMGGTGTITYTLGTETNNSGLFENLPAGTFNFMVTDANNCSSLIEVEIDEPAEIEISVNQITEVNCYGENSGSINLNAAGGNGTLNFALGNETNQSGAFENLVANTYEVIVTDANGCNTSIEFSINEPADLEVNILQNNPALCSGENSAMVQIEALGGAENYQFTMAGETNSTGLFENLFADDYMLNLTDANGCSETMLVSVVEPLAISIDELEVQDVLCFGENSGSIQITGGGGIGPLEFTLGNETNTTGSFSELPAGDYSIEISDANGCLNAVQTTINEADEIIAEVTQTQNVLCNGEASGTVQLNASGGTGDYSFILGTDFNDTGFFENLPAGNYEVMVADVSNCTTTLNFEIEESAPVELVLDQTQNVLCNGENSGSINLNASGGSGNIEFSLGNETNTTGVFENLPAGTYEVVATDNNMCTASMEIELTQPTAIAIEVLQQENANCFGENSGLISLNASGGNGAFTYALNNETNTSGTFENLEAGNYNIIITDQNNCSESIEISLTEPQPIEVTFEETQSINCAGDNATIEMNALGGTSDFEFSLGNETNSTGVFENLSAGNYTVISTDQNGCNTSTSIEIEEPQPLVTDISQTQNILCFEANEGTIQASATGGTGTYFFTLNGNTNSTGTFENLPAGTYDVQISDENNCESFQSISITQPDELTLVLGNIQPADCNGAANGSVQLQGAGGTGNLTFTLETQSNNNGFFENLTSGIYEVSMEDENGCVEILQITVNENNDISIGEVTLQNVNCFGDDNGMIEIDAVGGTGDLTYTLGNETNTTGIFENLPAGNYNILISDAANCNSFLPVEILEPTALLVFADEINPVECYGAITGSAHFVGSGGVGNYTFSLDGNTSTDGWFYDLPAGSHIVMIVDDNDCSATVIFDVQEPTELSSSLLNLTNDSGSGDGSITFEGVGGTPGYTYSLDGVNYQSENVFDNLSEGSYTGYVQDLNGCVSEFNFEIELESSISNPELGILEMNILPNPFSKNITVQFDLAFSQNIHLKLTSIAGQDILQKTNYLTHGKQNILLDVESNVPAGVYILSVRNDEEVIGHFKLIKQ